METTRSEQLFKKAVNLIPGGVNSPVRAFGNVGMTPRFIASANGVYLTDADGNKYLDYVGSWGPMILGHTREDVLEKVFEACKKGLSFGAATEAEVEMAELICSMVPSIEMIRMVNSGTEATMAAIRLAREYTGRDLIVKMDGHFHGMHEMVWYNHNNYPEIDEYGEVVTVPDSAGFPEGMEDHVKVIAFNNVEAFEHAVKKYAGKIAAVIMEPVSYNCGCVTSTSEYMHAMRKICDREGILMIFDEVITGLRFAPGSAQGFYGVKPDLSTFAKAISNGFPLALVGGKAEIMQHFNPTGPVICSGTCSGSLMPVMVGIECLKMVLEPGFYDRLEEKRAMLANGLNDLFQKHKINGHINAQGSQCAIYFGYEDMNIDTDVRASMSHFDVQMARKFVTECLNEHLYFHYYGDSRTPHHVGFTMAHSPQDIATSLERFDTVFRRIK